MNTEQKQRMRSAAVRALCLVGDFQRAVLQLQRRALLDGRGRSVVVGEGDEREGSANAFGAGFRRNEIDLGRFGKEFLEISLLRVLGQLANIDGVGRCLLLG